MIIGIDFDNTIIDYSESIKKIIKKKKYLIKKTNPTKEDLKNYVISRYSEDDWTKLQGEIYGKYIKYAKPSKNFLNFLDYFNKKNYKICIISHKTKFPIAGKKINLRKAAKDWCARNLNSKKYFYELYFANSVNEKLKKIEELKCNFFIDDLEHLIKRINNDIIKIWYSSQSKKKKKFFVSNKWDNIKSFIIKKVKKNFLLKHQGFNNLIFFDYKRRNFIKYFKSNDSFKREQKFLSTYSKKTSLIPSIKYIDKKNKILIMSEIKGTKVKKVDKNYLNQIYNFIGFLNKNYEKISKKFRNAKDHCIDIKNHIKLVEKYLHKFKIKNFKNREIKILYKQLNTDFQKEKNKIRDLNNSKNSDKIIISPSDFGFRNSLINKKKLYFFDFEYSGKDSLLKLLLDFYNCPEYRITNDNIEYLIKKFEAKYKIKIKKIFILLKNINKIKWTFIILNSILKPDFNKKLVLTKAKRYYEL